MRCLFALILAAGLAGAQSRLERYAVVLEAPPLAGETNPAKITEVRAAQAGIRAAIEARGVRVLHSTNRLVNAVYVLASEEQAAEIRRIYGVGRVEGVRRLRRALNKAGELVNAPAAWNITGGPDRAGQGVKIGILDSGIDHTHPSLKDDSSPIPPGYPKCRGDDCGYTNRKVIAARSYVDLLVIPEEPAISRPDDLSPRDRVGHGTAAASAAAGKLARGPAAEIRGVAPAAFLGNYKIFGSPGINDSTFDDVVIAALEDAIDDGMDIVSLSFGGPALWAPGDRGSVCGAPANEACDLLVEAVDNATRAGLTVVTVAGNDGDLGLRLPTLNSVQSPGAAASAITVGASTNGHAFYAGCTAEGGSRMRALFGNGPKPAEPLRALLQDVAKLEDDGKACSPLAKGVLEGAIALIERGGCNLSIKVNHAQAAGAVAAVIYQSQSNTITPMSGLSETGIPAALVGHDDGVALKSRTGGAVTLDPALQATDAEADLVAYFSSQGPSIGDSLIKPEISAVGTNMYMATQSYDPNGDMYDPSGYTVAQGTSFAAPMVAGAAAIARQRYPRLRPGQVKSLLVNTAADVLTDFDYSDQPINAPWTAGGNGILDVREMARANVTVEPATLSFGVLGPGVAPPVRTLIFTNLTNGTVNLRFDPRPSAAITLSPANLAIPANSSRELQVRLTSARTESGAYEGDIAVLGGAVTLRIPFLYLVGDNQPFNVFPLRGFDFTGAVNERLPGRLTLKVVDRNGVPVKDAPVRWGATLGNGEISEPNARTDELGIAEARAVLGPRLGEQEFAAGVGNLTVYFSGIARLRPLIETNGVVNAGSLRAGQGVAPGSYVAIYGRGLSDVTRFASTPYLPLSLSGVSVSFDVPSRRESYAGRLYYVSENQLNLQVPWELAGLNSAQMKVSIGDFSSALYTVPLSQYAPAAFEYPEAGTGRILAAARDEAFLLIGTDNPARRGRAIQIYTNGMGPVANQPPTGEPSPTQPLAASTLSPEVTIGGRPAQVLYSGLTPGAIALYQLNVVVPEDAAAGVQPVVITINGITAKTVFLPVQ
ncbi:MAG: S8 family serine peptidase [Bryobacteraceae bacterium]|nr:S8 family serine peptidase [Bryobacteraceae bacterium]